MYSTVLLYSYYTRRYVGYYLIWGTVVGTIHDDLNLLYVPGTTVPVLHVKNYTTYAYYVRSRFYFFPLVKNFVYVQHTVPESTYDVRVCVKLYLVRTISTVPSPRCP